MKVGDLVRKHTKVWVNMEPWWSHGLLAVGIVGWQIPNLRAEKEP